MSDETVLDAIAEIAGTYDWESRGFQKSVLQYIERLQMKLNSTEGVLEIECSNVAEIFERLGLCDEGEFDESYRSEAGWLKVAKIVCDMQDKIRRSAGSET